MRKLQKKTASDITHPVISGDSPQRWVEQQPPLLLLVSQEEPNFVALITVVGRDLELGPRVDSVRHRKHRDLPADRGSVVGVSGVELYRRL